MQPYSTDSGMWNQLQEQANAKQQLQLIAKSEKSKQLVGQADYVSSQDSKTTIIKKN